MAFLTSLVTAVAPAIAQSEAPTPSRVEPRILVNAVCPIGAVYAVASDAQGNVAVAGYCGDLNASPRAFVVKAASDGTVLWTHRLPASVRATNLALDRVGSVLIAGQSKAGNTTIGSLLKITSDGVPVWDRSIEPAQPGNMSCASVVTDADDSVYVSCGGSPEASGAVVAFRSDGSASWRRDGFDSAQSLFSANGKLYAASVTNARILDWTAGGVMADVYFSDARSVRVGQDGKVYVNHVRTDQGGSTISVYDETLTAIGSVVVNTGPGVTRSYDYFDVDARGNIYVLGAYYSTPELTGGSQYVAAYAPSGLPLWQFAADPSPSFTPRQSPAILNAAIGGSLVSVSNAGKCYVSTYLYLLEFATP